VRLIVPARALVLLVERRAAVPRMPLAALPLPLPLPSPSTLRRLGFTILRGGSCCMFR
jgi:hypothetical protein